MPPSSGTSAGRVVAWGDGALVDLFVTEAGYVLIRRYNAELVDRDGVSVAIWTPPVGAEGWPTEISAAAPAGEGAVVAYANPGILGPSGVAILAAGLYEDATIPIAPLRVDVSGGWLVASRSEFAIPRGGLYRLPGTVSLAVERFTSAVATSLTDEWFGAVGRGAAVVLLPTLDGLVRSGVASLDGSGPAPTQAVFTGPALNFLVSDYDVFALDVDACRDGRDGCVTLAADRGPSGHLAMAMPREGEGATYFTLATGASSSPVDGVLCQPDDIVSLGARCRLMRIDPLVRAPVWAVNWDRVVTSVVALEHDPWADALVVASQSPGDAGWAIESVPLP